MITAAARRFIYSTIAPVVTAAGWVTGGTPRVYHGVAPEGALFPFVVFQLLSPGTDQVTLVGNRVWSSPLYLVKTVAQGNSTGTIEATVDAIDTALHQSKGSVTGGIVKECIRERPHEQPEVTEGKYYVNLGGEYRLRIAEA